MLRLCIAGILFILICGCSYEDKVVTTSNIGIFHHIESFSSDYVESRPIDIWLPHGYEKNTEQQYPVMYLHDGQFMFCLLYTSPSPRDRTRSRMPSSA